MENNWEHIFAGKKILVTGGTGYLASSLIEMLSRIDCHILRVGHSAGFFSVADGKAYIEDITGDVTCPAFWATNLANISYVFHLAAYEHNHGAVFNPVLDYEVNTLSTLYMLEVCRIHKFAPFIVYASSSNIIGLPSQLPVDETCQDDPLIPFSINKLTSEKYLQFYAREFNQHSVALRLANVYGPVSNPHLNLRVVINRVINQAIKGGRLLLYQNSNCMRDYLWIEDAASSFLDAACLGEDNAKGQHYVIGSGTGYRIADVWSLIAEKISCKTGNTVLLDEISSEKLDAIEWRNFIADTSLFTKATGWKAGTSVDEGLERTIDALLITRNPAI